jgi:selenocysteine-specific elongation factor
MIVGTAGHIDHGKTTLVRALTGVDTDRLKEEKQRGISIELGYAYVRPPTGGELGFIDVPGHERLVHTMVAGACGIDFALLVVAADDGVMPQTREHLAILELLGVTRGAVALTKVDRVDEERRREVEEQLADVLATTPLAASPVFPVDATQPDDAGVLALARHLGEAAAQLQSRDDERLFRLAIDRVFTLAGHGVVVTGTVFSGSVRTGDALAVMPAGTPARVRGLRAQNQPAETGHAGQRCAVNVAGIEKSALARGDWLADPRLLAPTTRIDTRLRTLPESAVRLASGSPVHVHLGTLHQVAQLVLLDAERLPAGDSALVQLVFETPVCACPGDRFIVRDAQAAHTVGGGVVLDPYAPLRKRRSPQRLQYVDALERFVGGHGLTGLLEMARFGVRMSELVRLTSRAPGRIRLPAEALVVDGSPEQFVFLPAAWEQLRDHAVTALRAFHERVPDEPGPDAGRLRRMAAPDAPAALWASLVDELVRESRVLRNGPWLHVPEHRIQLSERDETLARGLQPLLAAGRFDPPWVRTLAARVGEPEERVRQVLRKQVTRGSVYQVVRDLFYDSGRISELAAIVAGIAHEHGGVDAARFRDAIGLGRKRSIQILEFFDRVGYTRRIGDAHVLRVDSGWRVGRS